MQIEFQTMKRDRILQRETLRRPDPQPGEWTRVLEEVIRTGCRSLQIPLPIWMQHNTTTFARFRQTIFFEDQFLEPVPYDRLQIRLLPDPEGEAEGPVPE